MKKQKKKKKLKSKVHKSKGKKRNSGSFGGSKKKTQLYDFVSQVLDITQESSKPSKRKSGRNLVGQLITGTFVPHPLNGFSWDLVRENYRIDKTTECSGVVIKEGFKSDKEFADFHIGVQGDWDIGLKSLYELMNKLDNQVDVDFSRMVIPDFRPPKIGESKSRLYLCEGIGYLSDDETSITIITKFKTDRPYYETLIRMCDTSKMNLYQEGSPDNPNDIKNYMDNFVKNVRV